MFKKISLILLSCALIASMIVPCFALEICHNKESESSIILIGYSIDTAQTADAETLEQLLYPSGMQLPTKYMDLLDFIPYDGIEVNDVVSNFMNKYWAEAEGKFTYAEYKAAERYFYYVSLNNLWGENNSIVSSLVELEETTNWKIYDSFVVPVLKDATHLNNAMIIYKSLLTALAIEDENYKQDGMYDYLSLLHDNQFALSLGETFTLNSYERDADYEVLSSEMYSDYLVNYPLLWEYFGVQLEETDFFINGTTDTEVFFNIDNLPDNIAVAPINLDLGVIDVSESTIGAEEQVNDTSTTTNPETGIGLDEGDTNEPDSEDIEEVIEKTYVLFDNPDLYLDTVEQETAKEDTGNSTMTSIYKEGESPGYYLTQDSTREDSTVATVDAPEDVVFYTPFTEKTYNATDLKIVIAVIFTFVSISVLWVLHTMQQLRDPLRKWLK